MEFDIVATAKKNKIEIFDNSGNVEMIPMVLTIFITAVLAYILSFIAYPIFSIVGHLTPIMDTGGSIYTDVGAKFDSAVSAFSFLLIFVVVKPIIHLGLLAIKKQRSEGSFESDF